MKQSIAKTRLAAKAPSLLVALALGMLLLPKPAVGGGIPVEEVMREFQGRYFFLTGSYMPWQACPCGSPAPNFPPNGFYGDLNQNPDLATNLIQYLADKFYSPSGTSTTLYDSFYKSTDGHDNIEGTAVDYPHTSGGYSLTDFPKSSGTAYNLTNVTQANWPADLKQLKGYIEQLNFVLVDLNIGCTNYLNNPFPEKSDCANFYQGGNSNSLAGCDGVKSQALSDWATNAPSNDYITDAWAVGVYSYAVSSDLGTNCYAQLITLDSPFDYTPPSYPQFSNGTLFVYLNLITNELGRGGNPSPVTVDEDWHIYQISNAIAGRTYSTGSIIPTPTTVDGSCTDTSGYFGWAVYNTPDLFVGGIDVTPPCALLEPNFNTSPDSAETSGSGGCSDGICSAIPGTVDIQTQNSLDFKISLGPAEFGTPAGYLYFNADQLNPALASTAGLSASTAGLFSSVSRDGSGNITTIYTYNATGTVDTGSQGYTITFNDHALTPNFISSLSVYLTNNQIIVSNIVGDPGNPAKVTVINYTNDGTGITWAKVEGGGLRTESITTTFDGSGNPTDVITVTDTNGAVASVTTNVYQMYPWGKTLVMQTLGTGSSALTTSWTYNGDGELTQMVKPTGRWEKYGYDSNGQLTTVVAQFCDNPSSSADSSNRVTQTSYTNGMITTVEYLLGTEISRAYEIHLLGDVSDTNIDEVVAIQCATAGAGTNASGNLTNILWRTTDNSITDVDPWATLQSSNQDGTMSFYGYSSYFDSGSGTFQKSTTVKSGVPNGTFDDIVDGTLSITVVGVNGQVVSNIVADVITGLPLVQDSYAYSDPLFRSYTVTHLDGTTETEYYDCCGLQYTIDRDGVETDNIYDAAKRQIGTARLGITNLNVLDGAGRTLATFRVGTDSTTNLVSAVNYDTAGFVLNETNGLGGVTAHWWTTNGAGETLVFSSNNVDGGTIVTTNFQDTSTYQTGGTATAPKSYLYGVDGSGVYVVARNLSSSGGTNEWAKSYVDLLDRQYMTVFAAASGTPTDISYFNTIGQRVKQVDPDGKVTLYAYNNKGEQTTVMVNLNGSGTVDTSNDRITFTTNDVLTDNGATVKRSRTYVCDTFGSSSSNLLSTVETSADGLRSWSTNFNNGTLITSWSRMVYAGSGYRYVTNMMPYGMYTVTTYLNGRLIATTSKDSGNNQIGQTTNGYDAQGRMNVVTDARTGTTTSYFNAMDSVSGMVTPSPTQITTNFFDNLDRITKTTLPDGTSRTNVFNPTDQTKQTYGSRTYPAGYGYDAQQRMAKLTNWTSFASSAGARVTTWNFDQYRGWLSSKQYDDGNGPRYDYTAAGRLADRYWARGTNTAYTYNGAGDVATMSYNDGVTPAMTNGYDRLGHRTVITNGAVVTTLIYNDLGSLLSESNSGGPLSGVSVTNGYDSTLRRFKLVVLTNGVAVCSVTNNYDAASRLSVIGDTTNSATYSYLANSSFVSQIVFKQSSTTRMTTTKGYDNLDRFLGVTNVNASSVVLDKHAYGYNSANQRTTVTNTDSSYWNFNYDFLGQVTAGKKYWSDGVAAAGEQFGYGFDDIGNRVNAQAGGNERGVGLRNSTYYVNDLNQYTSRTVPGFADIVGSSSTSSTVTVNGLSTYRHSDFFRAEVPISNTAGPVWQTITNLGVLGGGSNTVSNVTGNIFLPKNPELFTYDDDGNMTSDGRFTNVWDGENRLITITSRAGAATNSLVKLDITYDYMGRRIQKIVSTNSGSGYVASYTNRFVYDGWNVVAILDGGNHLMYSFVWGSDLSGTMQGAGGVGGLLSMTVYTGPNVGSYFYCYDGNGNVTALVNAADGTVVATYEYVPFGKLIGATGRMAFANSIRFSTKYQDDETEWHYYGYRYLSDRAWLSRDPKTNPDERTLYVFANNAPLSYIDVLGLQYVYIIFYIEPDATLMTQTARDGLKQIVLGAPWGLTRDTLKVGFIDRQGDSDVLGLHKVFCGELIGINVQQAHGFTTGPFGTQGNHGGILLYSDAISEIGSTYDLPFNVDVTVANVAAHESLFHYLAGFKDPVGSRLFGTSGANPHEVDSPNLNPWLILNLGSLSHESIDAIKKKYNIQ